MCACTTSVKVVSPRVEFSAVAVAVFAVAWAKNKNQKNQKNQKKMNHVCHQVPELEYDLPAKHS